MTTHAHDEQIARIAASERLLIALDFDGTLAPLIDEPMQARAIPAAREALDRLSALPDTVIALVSGRQLADLVIISEHPDDSPIHLAGSHGAEMWHPAAFAVPPRNMALEVTKRAESESIVAAAQGIVTDIPGAWIEPKAFGFGLHTRLSDAEGSDRAAAQIERLVAERAPHWRRRTGRDILEFAWRHEGKDSAVASLRELTGATAVLFAGDDVTDEDALASLGEHDLGVRVGSGETAATLRVADPGEFAALLGALATARAGRPE